MKMKQDQRHNDHRIKGQWLPTTRKEMEHLGWEQADVILFTGDAYIDHPSMGTAVIGRVLEANAVTMPTRLTVVPVPAPTIPPSSIAISSSVFSLTCLLWQAVLRCR